MIGLIYRQSCFVWTAGTTSSHALSGLQVDETARNQSMTALTRPFAPLDLISFRHVESCYRCQKVLYNATKYMYL